MDIYPTIPHKWHLNEKNTYAREEFDTSQLSGLSLELVV